MHPYHCLAARAGFQGSNRGLCQLEARRNVPEDDNIRAQGLAYQFFATLLVRESQDRVGVRVVNELPGKEDMNQCFDRRGGRTRIHEVGPEFIRHFLVRECRKSPEPLQVLEVETGVSFRLDARHVVSGGFYKNNGYDFSEDVCVRGLD